MAVEIPVVIDIDKAFEDAAKRVGAAMQPLQAQISDKALSLKIKIDDKTSKNLKTLLSDASLSSKQLNNALSDVERKINKIASTKTGFDMVNGLTERERSLLEAYTILQKKITGVGNTSTVTQKLISINIFRVKREIDQLTAKLSTTDKGSRRFQNLNNSLERARLNLRNLNAELKKVQTQNTFIGLDRSLDRSNSKMLNLIKNSARLIALHASTRFIRNVREVTAEFELQRVALAGIIQDTDKANSLFRQIKQTAIESPFQIKDLVSYTKQLSAYRIETEDLFGVTKRLADISAGLGVDMGRLILAYGQVRAASVLRGQELRQFTEAGVPLVDKLAEKFSDLNGRMVSTGEVFELISKRMVPFEMISEIFEDMTEKGGTFYKMQEKQAETLAGQWANLKDAVSIMYDEIGNTPKVHKAMEALISSARSLMSNWRTVASVIGSLGVQFGVFKVASAFIKQLTFNTTLAEKASLALARASELEAAAGNKANIAHRAQIANLKRYAEWTNKAAAAQTLIGRGANRLMASFLGGGWISMAVTAAAVLVSWFVSAQREAHRLAKEIEKIGSDGATSINRSVSNFQRLADAAMQAADGSDAQNKALEELKRTYGDIIPTQNLERDALRALEGDYRSLTSAIEEKINMQIKEQKVNTTVDFYSGKIQKGRKRAKNLLEQYGLDKEQINAVLDEVQRLVDQGMLGIGDSMASRAHTIEDVIKRLTGLEVELVDQFRYGAEKQFSRNVLSKTAFKLNDLVDVYVDLREEVKGINNDMSSSIGSMGIYADSLEKLKEELNSVTVSEEEFGEKFSFAFKKEKIRKQVEIMAAAIEKAFAGTNIDISAAFDPKGTINFAILNQLAAASKQWGLSNYVKNIQKSYESIIPTNKMVSVVERKFEEIATAVGLSMDDVQGYLLRGETDMKEYAKEISASLEDARNKVEELQLRREDYEKHPFVALPIQEGELEKANALVKFLELLGAYLSSFSKTTSGGTQTDPFVTQMQERIRFMQDFKKGYDELSKYMSSVQALDEQAGIMLGRGKALGLSSEEQKRAATDLSRWYSDMIEAVQTELRNKGVKGLTVTDFLGIDTTKKSKAIQDLQKLLQQLWDAKTDFDTSQKKEEIENSLKELSEEIKQSEIARDFYKNILDLTGDEDLAATMSVSVYGGIGQDFKERMQKQLDAALAELDWTELDDATFGNLSFAIITQDFNKIFEYIHLFPTDWQDMIKQMASATQKNNAEWYTNFIKTYQKAKTYQERIDTLQLQKQNKVREAQSMGVSQSGIDAVVAYYDKEIANVQLEAMKDTYTWTKAFEDLEGVSDRTLKNLIKLIDDYIEIYGKDLEPQQLKELARQRENARAQLVSRNAYTAVASAIRDLSAARKTATELQEKGQASSEEYTEALDDEQEAIRELRDALNKVQAEINDVIGSTKNLMSVFASDEDASYFNEQLDNISKTISGVSSAAVGIAQLIGGNITPQAIVQTISGVADTLAGVFGGVNAKQVRDANKEYERQAKLLKTLENSYNNVENAISKAFGNDYAYNFSKQLEILQAQYDAYIAQAQNREEAAQKESTKKNRKRYQEEGEEARNQAMSIQQSIEALRYEASASFAGADLASAAESFADAWLSAYEEFGDTSTAIEERMTEMVQTLMKKAALSGIAQNILGNWYSSLADVKDWNAQTIAEKWKEAMALVNPMVEGMQVFANSMQAEGVSLRNTVGQFTGISRDIAGASEESINGLAAGINTQNFYMSFMPMISENVAQILTYMTGGNTVAPAAQTGVEGMPSVQTIVYNNLPAIRSDIGDLLQLMKSVISVGNVAPRNYVAIK